jgi:L-ascorbate metabolism protein UlaG (beta-lactamase superfamily)
MKLTWLGHASWMIETGGHRVLLDPFLDDNPSAKVKADEIGDVSHILVSHGHFDHVADVASIGKRSGATVVANYEIAQWFGAKHGLADTIGMNIGGLVALPFGRVKMVPAIHSSSLPDGSYGGVAAGFVIESESKRVYFACDTSLFSDMRIIGKVGLDAAVLPIGDLFTMGVEDSIEAIDLLQPKLAVPTHYGTWPPIEQDAQAWATLVSEKTSARPVVLAVGEPIDV